MIRTLVLAGLVALTSAQVPGFGWCPEYSPMADFDLNRYTGVWYEAERYFTVLEAGSRCVRSNYTKSVDGKFRVSNEITNRLTGIRRVLDGVVQNIGKGGEGKIAVKYSTLPVPIDTQYSVLDTDYDTYSVVWSCSSLGPINTQNAWVMTRERLAPGTTLQQAYGVLDKHKISRTFFVKTDQSDCMFTDPAAIPPEKGVVGQEQVAEKVDAAKSEPVAAAMPEMAKEPAIAAMPEKMEKEPLKKEPEKMPVEMKPLPAEIKPMPAEDKPEPEAKPAIAEIKPIAPMKEESNKVASEPQRTQRTQRRLRHDFY